MKPLGSSQEQCKRGRTSIAKGKVSVGGVGSEKEMGGHPFMGPAVGEMTKDCRVLLSGNQQIAGSGV